MPTASGNNGAVNGLGSLMAWTLTDQQTANAYVTSNTAGGTGRGGGIADVSGTCLLYTSPSPRDQRGSRMPSSA